MSYTNTFIRIATDSTRRTAAEPPEGKPTVARLQYELLRDHPGKLTEKELLGRVHCLRNGLDPDPRGKDHERVWSELFSKPHACLRASPLPKTYGWGLHYDAAGRIRLVPAGTPEYETMTSGTLTQLHAMRSRAERPAK